MQPTAALVFSDCAHTRPDRSVTLHHVPAAQWLTLPCCLCCMAPTDPRLILLRALDNGAGAPAQPVDHVVIAVPAGLMKPVLRALDILAPLASRLGSATINGNDVGKSNVARGTGWLIWRAGFRRVINRPEADRCTRRIGRSDLRARCEALPTASPYRASRCASANA